VPVPRSLQLSSPTRHEANQYNLSSQAWLQPKQKLINIDPRFETATQVHMFWLHTLFCTIHNPVARSSCTASPKLSSRNISGNDCGWRARCSVRIDHYSSFAVEIESVAVTSRGDSGSVSVVSFTSWTPPPLGSSFSLSFTTHSPSKSSPRSCLCFAASLCK